jgi:hypothetical protein
VHLTVLTSFKSSPFTVLGRSTVEVARPSSAAPYYVITAKLKHPQPLFENVIGRVRRDQFSFRHLGNPHTDECDTDDEERLNASSLINDYILAVHDLGLSKKCRIVGEKSPFHRLRPLGREF